MLHWTKYFTYIGARNEEADKKHGFNSFRNNANNFWIFIGSYLQDYMRRFAQFGTICAI